MTAPPRAHAPNAASPAAFGAFAGIVLIWGSTFLVIRIGNDSLAPVWAATLRLAIASAILALIAVATRQKWPRGRALEAALLFGLVDFGVSLPLLYWGEMHVPSAIAAIFCTMESFNCRMFGGIGDPGQEQAADFLAAGGTFAIGHTWEPFANFTADVELVIRSFYLGNMSWAEAAYSAIPCLSWQIMVLGDPLAMPRRSVEDINNDNKVDIDDLYAWSANPTDLNRSGAADAVDLALLEAAIRGADHFATRR